MPNTTFKPYSLYHDNLTRKRTLTIDQFKGVDLSSSLFEVADNEAIDLDNIEYDKTLGRCVSRKGFEEVLLGKVLNLQGADYTGNLNGVFKYKNKMYLHIGTGLFSVGNLFGKNYTISQLSLQKIVGVSLADHKSFSFPTEDRLYILDGEKFKVLKEITENNSSYITIVDVEEDEDIYIPITTANIPCEELEISSAGSPLDDVNMLSPYRKNTFITPTETMFDNISNLILNFWCDTTCDLDALSFDVEITNYSSGNEETLSITFSKSNVSDTTWAYNGTSGIAINKNGRLHISLSKGWFTTNSVYNLSSSPANMTVTFKHDTGNADLINHCTFGKVFNDRLFLSGNPDYPNRDWHSSGDLNDFSYFSDLDYCNYGTKDTAIVGYDIYSSGILIVVKESSTTEPTLYTRTYEEKTARDYAGNVLKDYTEDYYKLNSINSMGGLGGLNNRAIVNFLGDTLILTRDGLKMLKSVQNVADNQRVFVDVSTKINSVLTKEDLSQAFMYCFNDRLYLKTPNYLFIAEYNLRDANNEYSWFKWSDIEPLYFFDYDDELYFTQSSDLCKIPFERILNKDTFTTVAGLGSAYIELNDDDSDTVVTISQNYIKELKNSGTISFNVPLYQKIGDSTGIIVNTEATPYFTSNIELVDKEKYTIAFNYYSGYPYERHENKEYTVRKLNDTTYYLVDGENTVILQGVQSLSIYKKIDSLTPLQFDLIDGSDNEFKLIDYTYEDENSNEVKVYYRFSILEDGDMTYPSDLTLQISFNGENNIKSFYYTKPINFGTSVYEKTIYQFSLVNDSKIGSHMELGYLASNKYSDYTMLYKAAEKGSRSLNLLDFTFGKVQFLNDKLPHIYTKSRKIPKLSFISFAFKNNEEDRMLLGELSIIYTITKIARGIK